MAKKGIIIVADYSKENLLTLHEVCEVCHISSDFLQELIEFDIVKPLGQMQNQWMFDMNQLNRIKKTIRLQRDLEVNLPGVVLILQLLEEMEKLRMQSELIEKHFFKL